MINSSVIGFAFIDKKFVISHNFLHILLKHKYKLKIFDKRKIQSEAITNFVIIDMIINQYIKT